jgi:hypothetical protein
MDECSPQPRPWLITFGDLLTLLLCFFIAQVRLGAGAGSSISEVSSRDAYAERPTVEPALKPGTALAQRSYDESVEALSVQPAMLQRSHRFLGRELEPAARRHGAGARARITSLFDSRGYEWQSVEVTVCARRVRHDSRSAASISIERAEVIARQLIDSGIPAALVRTRVLGAHCSPMPRRSRRAVELQVNTVLRRM